MKCEKCGKTDAEIYYAGEPGVLGLVCPDCTTQHFSIRDRFAMAAMQSPLLSKIYGGFVTENPAVEDPEFETVIAQCMYRFADAMIEARKR